MLEHTYSPADELHRAAALLKPGGLLAINVPNANSFDRAWFGPQWVGYDAPRHLYLFSQQTLAPLLGAAGFEVLQWQCFMSSYFAFAISLERSARAHKHLLATLTTKMLNFPGTRFLFEPYLSLMNSQQRGVVISVFARKR